MKGKCSAYRRGETVSKVIIHVYKIKNLFGYKITITFTFEEKQLMDEKIFKSDARAIVDMLFENKLFREDLTRIRMNALEDFIHFLLESRFDSYKKIDSLLLGIKRDKERNESTTFETDTVARKATP